MLSFVDDTLYQKSFGKFKKGLILNSKLQLFITALIKQIKRNVSSIIYRTSFFCKKHTTYSVSIKLK